MTASVYESSVRNSIARAGRIAAGYVCDLKGDSLCGVAIGSCLDCCTKRIMELNRPDSTLLTDLAQLRDEYRAKWKSYMEGNPANGTTFLSVADELTELLKRHDHE